jgi:hypothetical protein
MNKIFAVLLSFFLLSFSLQAQVQDDFSDPTQSFNIWQGDWANFQINAQQQLQLNATAAGASYLSAPSTSLDNTEWRFYIRLNFAPSANNFARVYLASDQSDVTAASQNGYFLQFGENGSNDAVELFRQSGTNLLSVCRGPNGQIANAFTISVRVIRDNAGNWELFVDPNAGTAFIPAASGTNSDITTSTFFGLRATYTVTNITNFFFDDVYVGPIIVDTTPPSPTSATAISNNQVDLFFDEAVSLTTANNASNYNIDGGIGQPQSATRDAVNFNVVHLQLATTLTNGQSYQLTVNNMEDLSGNAMTGPESVSFSYVVPVPAGFRDIIISEIMAKPSPVVGLPNAEYVEIYNRSANAIDITGWKIIRNTTGTITPYILLPGQYVTLSSTANAPLFQPFGPSINATSFPTLTDNSGLIVLQNAALQTIDSVNYDISWYQDPVKQGGGWSLEIINPDIASNCALGSNWIDSNSLLGGTPGNPNSVLSIIPDVVPPTVTGINTPTAQQVVICFSEVVSQNLLNQASLYSINNGIGSPVSVLTANGSSCVTLNLANPLQAGVTYTITLPAISDCSGNLLQTLTYNFSFFLPQPFEVVINEIFADPTPQVGLPAFEFLELYNKTASPVNLGGWQLSIGNSNLNLSAQVIPPDSFIVLCAPSAAADFQGYGIVLPVTGMSSTALTNGGTTVTLRNNVGTIMHTVTYSDSWYDDNIKKDGGWSLEMIDANNPCAGTSNWRASEHPDGGTPGRRNSIAGNFPDNAPPSLGGGRVVNSNLVEIYFTEPVTNTAVLSAADFVINNGIGSPASISFTGVIPTSVFLSLSNALQQNIIYTVTLNTPLQDCAGNNSSAGISTTFALYEPKLFDVVIHEIMADPDPPVDLPNAEYIELYNTTDFPINVLNWKILYSSSSKSLPAAVIPAKGYLILCAPQFQGVFSFLGNTAAVAGLPTSSFSNSGTNLVLRDSLDRTIHSVNYSDTWYGNSSKINGGWSLEMIDPLNPCAGPNNWRASEDPTGGTPGKANSIAGNNPDNTAPRISGVCPQSLSVIDVFFNEPQDSTTLVSTNHFTVNNGIGNPQTVIFSDPSYRSVTLVFATPMQQNTTYTLSLSNNITDCAGNPVSNAGNNSFHFGTVEAFDLVINEIFADPTPVVGLPDMEYLELFNRKNFPIHLNGWTLSVGSSNITTGCVVVPANGYLTMLTRNGDAENPVYGNAAAIDGFSSITNSGATITLREPLGRVISTVTFSDRWYGSSLKTDGGWSLEQIDPNNPCGGQDNWTASNHPSGGTPGRINSVNAPNPDNAPPQVWRVVVIDSLTIELYFNEPLDLSSALNLNLYTIDKGIGNPITVTPLAPDYTIVRLNLLNRLFRNTIYTITVTGTVRDCFGNTLSAIDNAQFGMPESATTGSLLVNEVLFNPRTDGVDYIEFYNNTSNVIDLRNLRIANWDAEAETFISPRETVPNGFQVLPGDYVCLSTNTRAVQSQYFTPNPRNFAEVASMPSLNNTSGSAAIITNTGLVIDYMIYDDKMHFPLLNDVKGVSLERINFERSAMERNNWISAAQAVNFGTPAYRNSQAGIIPEGTDVLTFSSEIFSPDNDGFNDVLIITYRMDKPGYVAKALVFDARGRRVKTLMESELLGSEGTFSWDGITDSNLKGELGIYILYFEYFDTEGNVKKIKKSFVLGGRL